MRPRRSRPTNGTRRRNPRPAPGGRPGRSGSRSTPPRSSSLRRPWAAPRRATHRSPMRPASTSSKNRRHGMNEVVITAALRTAVGKFNGSLTKVPASELGAQLIKALLERSGIEGKHISEVIMGQVLAAGAGQNTARQALIRAGLPEGVPGMTINKVCGSGLKAGHLAAQAIRCWDADIVIAGGQENMSASPHLLPGSREGFRLGDAKLVDSMIVDGLWDAYNDYHMGTTAENVAKQYAISRREQDEFAAASQQKAEAAQKAGRFKAEIAPIEIAARKTT